MCKKNYYFFGFFIFIVSVFIIEIIYIDRTKKITPNMIATKNHFVKITSLPDLAISTETNYIRHRSLSDIFSIYQDDGRLREYSPSTFTYQPSRILYEN